MGEVNGGSAAAEGKGGTLVDTDGCKIGMLDKDFKSRRLASGSEPMGLSRPEGRGSIGEHCECIARNPAGSYSANGVDAQAAERRRTKRRTPLCLAVGKSKCFEPITCLYLVVGGGPRG